MRLLALEARQNAHYYLSRYQQVEELGAHLSVMNGVGDDGYWAADRYRVVGSQHIDDIVTAASAWHAREAFDGVLTFSESAVVAVAVVAEALGLPGVEVAAARASRNKLLMRHAHEKGGAPCPRFRFVDDLDEALSAAEEFGYPVVLKPTLGCMSNFVFRIDTPGVMRLRFSQATAGIEDMPWYAMEAHGIELGPHGMLVESFLDGRELLIEGVAWDGEVYLASVVDRVTVEGDTFDDDVHRAPTSLTADELTDVHEAVAAGAAAQGVKRGVLHAEVRFHQGRPYLLEIAIRPGGGFLDHFARLTAGHDPIKALVDVTCGVRPALKHFTPTGRHLAGMVLLCDPGRIESIELPDPVDGRDVTRLVKLMARPGDVIRRPPDGNNILGFLAYVAGSFEEALDKAVAFASAVRVRFTEGSSA